MTAEAAAHAHSVIMSVGNRVEIVEAGKERRRRCGVLKFIGETHFCAGTWCGVLLDNPVGKNDGTVDGVKYFECPVNRGLFVAISKVRLEPDSLPAAKPALQARSKIARPSNGGRKVGKRVETCGQENVREFDSKPPPQHHQQQRGSSVKHQTIGTERLALVARAPSSQSHGWKHRAEKGHGVSKRSGLRSDSESSTRQSTSSCEATESEKRKNTFTIQHHQPSEPISSTETKNKDSVTKNKDSVDMEEDDSNVLIANISPCVMIPVAFSTPVAARFGSDSHSNTQSTALLTPESEAVMLVEANRVGRELRQSALATGLGNVGTAGRGADVQLAEAMKVVGCLCERLSHGCCVFDVLAVVVGHLSGKLERSQRSKWKAWDCCEELQCRVQESSDRLTALELEKAHLQQQYKALCATAEDEQSKYTEQLKVLESNNELLRSQINTLKTEYETTKRNLEEGNEASSSKTKEPAT